MQPTNRQNNQLTNQPTNQQFSEVFKNACVFYFKFKIIISLLIFSQFAGIQIISCISLIVDCILSWCKLVIAEKISSSSLKTDGKTRQWWFHAKLFSGGDVPFQRKGASLSYKPNQQNRYLSFLKCLKSLKKLIDILEEDEHGAFVSLHP